ncbi:sigma-54-dependent transcriptional regulator [Sporomusa aerivorans]|uniref:sigma-54-dependent transcriptional regulator n=1 Tax=Sporomusa aerivorans TaxID=204936 RepID=UPI00352B7300
MKKSDFRILVVEDDPEYQEALLLILEEEGYLGKRASSGANALELLGKGSFDLILADMMMPGMTGIELLVRMRSQGISTEVIIITGFGTIDTAVEAMKKGAFSYFIKGSNIEGLVLEIQKLYELKNLREENAYLLQQQESPYLLTTHNPEYQEMLDLLEKAASSSINILLMGPSGVGKEVIARHIHKLSPRSKGRFVAVNCQALSEQLLESELFGHEKGAFTGALERRVGRFEEAQCGTFFLDEIGEIALSTQVKLLRTLENRTIERLGSNRSIPVDMRLISATNKNLYTEVMHGRFREDLFYRINNIVAEIPPLSQRREDIDGFIKFFFNKFSQEQKKKIIEIDPAALRFLKEYDYPGNIREMKNIIERLIVLSENGVITSLGLSHTRYTDSLVHGPGPVNLRDFRSQAEREHIRSILLKCKGNQAMAAQMLGITRRQLYNKKVEYGLD